MGVPNRYNVQEGDATMIIIAAVFVWTNTILLNSKILQTEKDFVVVGFKNLVARASYLLVCSPR